MSTLSARIPAHLGPYRCGPHHPLVVIAGPCVIENESLLMQIADALAVIARGLPVQMVFKASFDKANRTSGASFRGPGIDEGMRILKKVKDEVNEMFPSKLNYYRLTELKNGLN